MLHPPARYEPANPAGGYEAGRLTRLGRLSAAPGEGVAQTSAVTRSFATLAIRVLVATPNCAASSTRFDTPAIRDATGFG